MRRTRPLPLRRIAPFALGGALLACGAIAGGAPRRAPKAPAEAPAAPAPPPRAATPPVDLTTLPDGEFCGVQPAGDGGAPPSCKLPGLPCGPVPAARIGQGGAEAHDDLDGDGRADITLAGRRDAPRAEAYGVIYLARGTEGEEGAYVLSDYHPVDSRADPQVATPALRLPSGPPLLRDGFDLPPDSAGGTLSIARLRRWDGQRFRTLLRFCAHRAAPLPAGGAREGHNRVDFIDVDRDGTPEVVISGLLRPTVYRLAPGGLQLAEDAPLTERYRDESPQEQRARALRAEAARLVEEGQFRRAATTLARAHDIAPYNVEVLVQLGAALVRSGEAQRAVEALRKAEGLAPERPAPSCGLAEAYRKLDDGAAERKALEACLAKGPGPERRRGAEERLRALSAEEAAPPAAAPAAPAPAP